MTFKKIIVSLSLGFCFYPAFSQTKEADKVKNEHAQIGIAEVKNPSYKRTTNPGAQWFPQAGFGMFIHWGIASIKEVDLSWPMIACNNIGWSSPKMDPAEVKKVMDSGDYFANTSCKKNNTCLTPTEYWAAAKDFNPKDYEPEKWIKAAKEAGMTYAVLTTKHHDGFALWPSAYGNFNTKNYMGGRDLVKEYVAACRKYGLKVGLYFSGPDWYFNQDYQDFMNYAVRQNYKDIPVLDKNLRPRTAIKSKEELEAHYKEVAAYVKGQIEELLTNYGKIDMIWFDGKADIPRGDKAWNECISMERIHELQPGIVVSPRFYGYGDYKTFEGDKALPAKKQDGWAELCLISATSGWGYTKFNLKPSASLLNYLVECRAVNTNLLLNYGPTKDGVLTPEMYKSLGDIAGWMKINGTAVKETEALSETETASVPATAKKNHRYLFVMQKKKEENLSDVKVDFTTNTPIKKVSLLGSKQKLEYTVENNKLTVIVPASIRTALGDVVDVELK